MPLERGCDPLFIGGGGVGATPAPRQRSASPLLSTIGSNRLRTDLGMDGVDFHHVGMVMAVGGPKPPPWPFSRMGGGPMGPPPTSQGWPMGQRKEWAPFGPLKDSAESPPGGFWLSSAPWCWSHLSFMVIAGSELIVDPNCFI